MDKIEGEQLNCHFTINEGDAGDAALFPLIFERQVTERKKITNI
jgi:hypothetical protein